MKRLFWTLFPRYSPTIDVVNRNARLRAWASANAATPSFPERAQLYRYVNETCCGAGQIDLLEFGVASGSSLKLWTQTNTHPQSRFIGFDTFEGLPEAWDAGVAFRAPKGRFSQGGRIPEFDDDRVSFCKGLFQETLPTFLQGFVPRANLVVHHDSDLYSSTTYCLTRMNDVCTKGTVLIFDDFYASLHQFRAYEDYVASYRRTLRPVGMTSDYGVPLVVAFVYD